MKKVIAVFIVAIMIISVSGIFAQVDKTREEKVISALEKKGISRDRIKNITSLPPSEWHKKLNTLGIENTSINIQEVEIENDRPVFAISASKINKKVEKKKETVDYSRSLLVFGKQSAISSSFVETSSGIETGLQKGYVMTRDGSITGISSNLEILENSNENIEIMILKNGETVGFGNRFSSSVGVDKDFDTISKDTIEFSAGDVISVYIETNSEVKDLNTLVEITTKIQ